MTRRDFLVGAGTGAVAVGVVAGAGFAATQSARPAVAPQPVTQPVAGGPAAVTVPAPAVAPPAQKPAAQPQAPTAPTAPALPLTMRRVTLQIDGRKHDLTVDVRESLWETLVNQLGQASSNLGCDRAQCGACAVLVDGKAVNSCTVLSARLGRGQQIMTVASLAKGSGVDGLHPIQKAFWQEGGFQCGICTRGFIMSTYALLQTTKSPTDAQIAEALGGNICRCGEYAKVYPSVQKAAAEMRGERVTYTAPAAIFEMAKPKDTAATTTAVPGVSKQFEYVSPLATIEEFDPLAEEIKQRAGILEVSGSERTITLKWDPAKVDEAGVRKYLSELGRELKP